MAKNATPTFSPTGGQVNPGSTVTISCATAGVTIYYTFGNAPANTGWTVYSAPVALPATSGTTNVLSAYAVKAGETDSDVATATFYTVGFSGAVSANAVAILDTNSTQGLGSVCEGVGLSGTDGVSIGGQRIGASSTTTNLKYETGSL